MSLRSAQQLPAESTKLASMPWKLPVRRGRLIVHVEGACDISPTIISPHRSKMHGRVHSTDESGDVPMVEAKMIRMTRIVILKG